MNILLVIALTAVIVGYTSALPDGSQPQGNKTSGLSGKERNGSANSQPEGNKTSGLSGKESNGSANSQPQGNKTSGLSGKERNGSANSQPQGNKTSGWFSKLRGKSSISQPQGNKTSGLSGKERNGSANSQPQGNKTSGWFSKLRGKSSISQPQGNKTSGLFSKLLRGRSNSQPQGNKTSSLARKWGRGRVNSQPQAYKKSQTHDVRGTCRREGIPPHPCFLSPLVFTSQVTVDEYNCYGTFTAKDFTRVPRVQWSVADPNAEYIFFFIGNDTVLHWAICNIPGTVLRGDGNIEPFHKLAEYQPPEAPASALVHFKPILYRQTRQIPTSLGPIDRNTFNMKNFSQEHELCGPRAALEVWIKPDRRS